MYSVNSSLKRNCFLTKREEVFLTERKVKKFKFKRKVTFPIKIEAMGSDSLRTNGEPVKGVNEIIFFRKILFLQTFHNDLLI